MKKLMYQQLRSQTREFEFRTQHIDSRGIALVGKPTTGIHLLGDRSPIWGTCRYHLDRHLRVDQTRDLLQDHLVGRANHTFDLLDYFFGRAGFLILKESG